MTSVSVLDESQRTLLTSVLNRLIPARENLPGAGDLNVGASIERSMADAPRLRRLLLDGLVEITVASERQSFVDLDTKRQIEVLQDIENRHPAFFAVLVEHTYRGYYTLPAVHQAIGHESRPPQPQGHRLPPFDPSLLTQQRERLPFWRRTGPD
jgi:hypothetical protein